MENDNREVITNPARIRGIISNIHKSRNLLNVSLPDDSHQYNSIILDIDADNKTITLDELNPKEGHERFLTKKIALISTTIHGVDIRFQVDLHNVASSDDIAYYIAGIPNKLDYHQLRAYHRVPIGLNSIPVLLIQNDKDVLEGELRDISAGGVSIRFANKLPETIKRGTLIPTCMIELGNKDKISAELEIRFISKPDDKKHIQIGARFVGMDKPQQRIVERFVASLDRELRRKVPGN